MSVMLSPLSKILPTLLGVNTQTTSLDYFLTQLLSSALFKIYFYRIIDDQVHEFIKSLQNATIKIIATTFEV
jgi:hypothetical protein